MINLKAKEQARPFIKWAGGKGIQTNKVNTGGSLFSSNDPWSAKVGG